MQTLQKILEEKYSQSISKVTKPKLRARSQVIADRLHEKLGMGEDFSNYPLLVRIAKHTPEARIEAALSWISDYPRTRNKLRLFLWRLKQLRLDAKSKSIHATTTGTA